MPAKVSLRDIVEAFDMQSDGFLSFVNIETGEVETVSREVMGVAEESEKGEDYEKGDDPQWDLAVKIASAPNYKGLPTQYDIHEWSIMEEFARSPASERMSGELLDALLEESFDRLRSMPTKLVVDWFWLPG